MFKIKKTKQYVELPYKQLAIRFGDNDFTSTFIPILNSIANAVENNPTIRFTKEQLALIIRELALGSYLLNQNRFKYDNGEKDHIEHIRKYLVESITEDIILLDDEVDIWRKNKDQHNGECWAIIFNYQTSPTYSERNYPMLERIGVRGDLSYSIEYL